MSALSLEKNGRILSSKQTKHKKTKFFLIKDYYEAGEIDVQYCPTDVMWADVLTKPLQGQKLRDMREFLQNCSRSYDDNIELQTDKLAQKSLKQQVKTVASSREYWVSINTVIHRRHQKPSTTRVVHPPLSLCHSSSNCLTLCPPPPSSCHVVPLLITLRHPFFCHLLVLRCLPHPSCRYVGRPLLLHFLPPARFTI